MSADNRCLPGLDFHFTLPVAVPTYWRSGADHLVVSRQSMFARVKIPFHDTCSSSGQRATLVQISPLSADNRCLPGLDFHFTLPVAVPASWHSGADHLVVSRQSMFARVIIPFHDTCSSPGQRVLWCRSARCQPTIEFAGVRFPFHATCSSSSLLALWCRSPRCQSTMDVYQGRNSIPRYL